MVKHKVPADVRSLADRYFCEQCDRLGLPRPHAIKPIKLGKTMREVVIDQAKMDRDTADGLAIEAMLAGEKAPRMGLDAILRAYSDGEDR